ncbi:MAG: dienelactone hydrolase [Verrucomicrobiaceae bacterium]|nr:dienelactone hydrolase [Verrucomicrobiaceae bacterium]
MKSRRLLPALLSVIGLIALVSAQVEASTSGVVEGKTSYQSGGRKIKVDTFLPTTPGPHPAVLVLYGSGGAVFGKGDMNDFSRKLASRGMAAYQVHYLNRTGSIVETGDRVITKLWPEWNEAVRDGVDFVCTQPGVKKGAVGFYGYSLGAFLSVSESFDDKRVRAVVELSGGVFDKMIGKAKRFPPMLVLHGSEDKRVSVEQVAKLKREARRLGTTPKVKIYEGEGHALSKTAAADATERALKFLSQHLLPSR